ncbi:MAG: hypothetical protein ACRBBN_01455 [Methyloligellaceae bacterium]
MNSEAFIDSPQAAEELCTSLIETTADLISVLERETQLVKNAASQDFSAITTKKHALSITLMRNMETLKAHAAYIKSVVPEQVTILKEQQDQFHRSLEINHSALTAMKAVSEGLLQTIANKSARHHGGPQVYNNEAGFNSAIKQKAGPVSLDTTL